MRKTVQLTLLVIILSIANLVLDKVLQLNQQNNLYDPDHDSIILPIMDMYVLSFLIFTFTVLGIFLPRRKYFNFVAILFASLAALISLGSIFLWLTPDHYWIAGCNSLLTLFSFYLLYSAWTLRRGSKKLDTEN